MIEAEAIVVLLEPKIAPIITPMPNPVLATTSQDIPATPTIAKTLMLLTSGPQFDKTATQIHFESAKSSKSQSHHTAKLPSGAPSNADAFPDPTETQMDLILTS